MSKFVYFNKNPDGNRESDCVTRAISLASGLSYEDIRKKLYHTGKLFGCERLCMSCYRHLIEQVFKYIPIDCDGLLVGEFAERHHIGVYLVRMRSHITCVIDGKLYDTWDCSNELCTDAWQVF